MSRPWSRPDHAGEEWSISDAGSERCRSSERDAAAAPTEPCRTASQPTKGNSTQLVGPVVPKNTNQHTAAITVSATACSTRRLAGRFESVCEQQDQRGNDQLTEQVTGPPRQHRRSPWQAIDQQRRCADDRTQAGCCGRHDDEPADAHRADLTQPATNEPIDQPRRQQRLDGVRQAEPGGHAATETVRDVDRDLDPDDQRHHHQPRSPARQHERRHRHPGGREEHGCRVAADRE